MRAKHFLHNVKESAGDGAVANAVVAEVIKLIGEGHTEVSPDVITTKVSAALGKPFMLKDLVAANNSSPELQHYIDSINPSKIKFSTDILTVKNQDPVKEKERSQAGVASMAARAAGRSRLGESIHSQGYTIDLDRENNELVFSRDGVVVHKERAAAGKGRPAGFDSLKKRINAVIEKLEDTLDPTGLDEESEVSVAGGPVRHEKGYYSIWTRKPGTDRWTPVTKYPDPKEAEAIKSDLEGKGYEVIVRESLRHGEYHVWKVHFDDGTSANLKVPSDEISFAQIKEFFAKKGKVAVEVDYNWDVQGDRYDTRHEPEPYEKKLGISEEKQRLDPKCWKGYKKQGTKMKGGVRVNNCVPVEEEWSQKYKDSINCSNPKGFSQKAHCAGKKKK